MTDNPYAAPQSDISADAGTVPIYSPNQVAAGAFIGGPVGLIYFLWENFVTLGHAQQARKSLIWGAVLIVALLLILPWLPDKFPGIAFMLVYMAAGRQLANNQQLTKRAIDDSPRYMYESNWRVFGKGLLCMLGSFIVVVTPLWLLATMGVAYGS